MYYRYRFLISAIMLLLFIGSAAAQDSTCPPSAKSTGQTVYVPAYSHIYHGNKESPLLLSVTLSLRNIDPENTITVTAVDYYETQGKLIKHFLTRPISLDPLGSERYIIAQNDSSGGSGANFIVIWQADSPTNPPIIETVMIGTQSQLGISFTSRGKALLK